jgi:transcriptional regulator with XRE-family HTH domain
MLRRPRRDRRISQDELAAEVQVTLRYLSQLEAGVQTTPPRLVLQRLAKALGVAVGELAE